MRVFIVIDDAYRERSLVVSHTLDSGDFVGNPCIPSTEKA